MSDRRYELRPEHHGRAAPAARPMVRPCNLLSGTSWVAMIALILSFPAAHGLAAQNNGDPAGGNGADTARLDGPPPAVDPALLRLGRDSVTAKPGETYRAGAVHRFFFGDLNRRLWDVPFSVPVLDLDSVGGGLRLDELSGGKQTLGIKFAGNDGLTYQFRSIVKDASRAIPGPLRQTPVDDVLQDQMAAQFPLSAMVVAELLEAAGVLVAKPRPVVMPDDPRLGEYREAFAGRMGWIEVRPNERDGDRPGFAGSRKITDGMEIFEELREDPASYVNTRDFLRARLIDMFVGDWDRHQDQWRWARFEDGGRFRWEPVPRDRDWALNRIDGLIPRIAGIYFPKYTGLSEEFPDPKRLAWSAQHIDRRLLSELDREEFMEVAGELQDRLSDATIDRAIGVLPEPYLAVEGARLNRELTSRRDALVDFAERYYEMLAQWVDVYATDVTDTVQVGLTEDGGVRVTVRSGDGTSWVRFDRRFDPEETAEVRLYLMEGDDLVSIESGPGLPLNLRVAGGDGDDRYHDSGSSRGVLVYDDDGDNAFELGDEVYIDESDYEDVDDEFPDIDMTWDTRDWGSEWVPYPALEYDSDAGLLLGAGVTRYGFGFRHVPYESRLAIRVLKGLRPEESKGSMDLSVPYTESGVRGVFGFDWTTDRSIRFFGFGNEAEVVQGDDFHESRRSAIRFGTRIEHGPDEGTRWWVGPSVTFLEAVSRAGTIFEQTNLYGAAEFNQLAVTGGVRRDTRDSQSAARSGNVLELTARVLPPMLDVEETFAGVRAEARTHLSSELPGRPALALRGIGERTWGAAPIGEAAGLGGLRSLPGFAERRFLGHSTLAATGVLRLQLARTDVLSEVAVGVHGLAATGRVWHHDEPSDRWHSAFGGGVWAHFAGIDRTVSFSLVDGDQGVRTYLRFGMPF